MIYFGFCGQLVVVLISVFGSSLTYGFGFSFWLVCLYLSWCCLLVGCWASRSVVLILLWFGVVLLCDFMFYCWLCVWFGWCIVGVV